MPFAPNGSGTELTTKLKQQGDYSGPEIVAKQGPFKL
jgi:hypothetical protein